MCAFLDGRRSRVSDSIAFRLLTIQDFCSSHTTKQMTHSRSWDMEIGRPSVENVTLGLRHRVTFSTSSCHIFMSHSLPCVIC